LVKEGTDFCKLEVVEFITKIKAFLF
jgi:hypothetical protein